MSVNINPGYATTATRAVNLFCHGNKEGALVVLGKCNLNVQQATKIDTIFNRFAIDPNTGKPRLGNTTELQLKDYVLAVLSGTDINASESVQPEILCSNEIILLNAPSKAPLKNEIFIDASCTQEFGQTIDFWNGGVFSQLSVRDLATMKATCKVFYFIIITDKGYSDKLDFPNNIHRWAAEKNQWMRDQFFYVNRGFLSPMDLSPFQCTCQSGAFSLQTVLHVARCFREGVLTIAPCAIGVHQPRSLPPTSYIAGMHGSPVVRLDSARIYFHLWKVQGSPWGGDLKHGEKAFYDCEGFSSTNLEKAEACERYVVEIFLNKFPHGK